MIEMSVLPNHFALAEAKSSALARQPSVAHVSKPSSSGTHSDYQRSTPPRQPTDYEKDMARDLAEAGLTGPPPAFQISVLEAQTDMDFVIKQMEMAHEKSATQQAIKPTAPEPEVKLPDQATLGEMFV